MKTNILNLIFVFVILLGCKKNDNPYSDVYLTDEDKQWNIYHLYDTVKFLSNFGNHRSFVVTEINDQMINHEVITDNGTESYNYECLSIELNRMDSISYFYIGITRGYGYHDRDLTIFFGYENGLLNNIELNGNYSFNINNVNYVNVGAIHGYKEPFSIAYYQKQKGLLRFEKISGEIWERSN